MGEKHLEKLDFDPYDTLELTEECSIEDIKKAYRKKALQWHPDKNPDRREYAQKMFLEIAKASEILLDVSAKAALDRMRKAKREHKQRTQKLDAKRRKLREDLEAREQQNVSEKEDEAAAAEKLAQEVERLRKQGSDLLKDMREEVERQIQKEKAAAAASSSQANGADTHNRLKVSWPIDSASFDTDSLTQRFSKYGSVIAAVVGPAKKKSKLRTALIEFPTYEEAQLALISENSISDNVLTVSWLTPPPPPPTSVGRQSPAYPAASSNRPGSDISSRSNSPFTRVEAALPNERDFESVVLMRMRQAEERKRLTEQMQREDGEETA